MTCLRAHPSKWHRLAGLTPKPTLEASVSSSPSWFTWRCSCKLGTDLPWDRPLRQVLFLVSSCRHHIRGLKEVSDLSNVPEPRCDGTQIWTQIFLALEQPSQAPSSVDSLQGEIQVACKYLKELSMEEGVGWLSVALGQTQVHGEMGWWAGALSQETYTSPDSTSQHLDVLGQVPPSQGPRGHPRKPRDALLSWTKAGINCRLVWQDWHPPHHYLASHCPLSWFPTVQQHVFFITWGKGSNYGTVPKIAFLQWSPKEASVLLCFETLQLNEQGSCVCRQTGLGLQAGPGYYQLAGKSLNLQVLICKMGKTQLSGCDAEWVGTWVPASATHRAWHTRSARSVVTIIVAECCLRWGQPTYPSPSGLRLWTQKPWGSFPPRLTWSPGSQVFGWAHLSSRSLSELKSHGGTSLVV